MDLSPTSYTRGPAFVRLRCVELLRSNDALSGNPSSFLSLFMPQVLANDVPTREAEAAKAATAGHPASALERVLLDANQRGRDMQKARRPAPGPGRNSDQFGLESREHQAALDLCGRASESAASARPAETGTPASAWRLRTRADWRARVLVVEDDDAMCDAIVRSLRVDYDVVIARDGAEGLETAEAATFDAIVTDVWMPKLDGIAMVNKLRAHLAPATVPVLFLSGEGAMATVAAAYATGATAYLPKPVDFAWLGQEIRWMLT